MSTSNSDTNNPQKTLKPIQPKKSNVDLWMAIVAIIVVLAAGFIGYSTNAASIEPALKKAVPLAERFEKLDDLTYAAYANNEDNSFLNYVSLGEANGYGGPLLLAVATDDKGDITGLAVVEQRETPSWFKRIAEHDFVSTLLGKNYTDAFSVENDVHAVGGATVTSNAIAKAALEGSRQIAGTHLGLPVSAKPEVEIEFGAPEIILLVLYIMAFIGHRKQFKYTKQARWLCMIAGMVFLGFLYTNLLTISYINQFLLGFWPDWRTDLYYYMLLGGVFLVLVIDNKNPYCLWFCPFGAVQECMGLVGGAKQIQAKFLANGLKWMQRLLALTAIVVALILRNPGLSAYEVFGTFFDVNGSILSFMLLGLVLLASIFIRRPWCNFLCPIPPIEGFIKLFRRKIKEKFVKQGGVNNE